jgi:hypothetical protein
MQDGAALFHLRWRGRITKGRRRLALSLWQEGCVLSVPPLAGEGAQTARLRP